MPKKHKSISQRKKKNSKNDFVNPNIIQAAHLLNAFFAEVKKIKHC